MKIDGRGSTRSVPILSLQLFKWPAAVVNSYVPTVLLDLLGSDANYAIFQQYFSRDVSELRSPIQAPAAKPDIFAQRQDGRLRTYWIPLLARENS